MKKEARYYKKLDNKKSRCMLCPHLCILEDGRTGFCQIRKNDSGKLYTMTYGEVSSIAMDPIEKKPLYHFKPGTDVLSVGTIGCNFRCPYCQNYEISQFLAPTRYISPQELIEIALGRGSKGIAYTYSEPLIWYEYIYDCASLAKEKGLYNVLVTNGFINQQPLLKLLPFIDAANIDLKSINNEFYTSIVKGKLLPVLETIKTMKRSTHIEITNLVIPTLNDDNKDIEKLVDFVESVDKDIPLHFSRYFPHNQMDIEPTSLEKLIQCYEIAKKKLNYVYIGNIMDSKYNTTYCPNCNSTIISRSGYSVKLNSLEDNKCTNCGQEIKLIY